MEACSICGVERPSLHTHHKIARVEGGTDDPENLIRVCANCHEDIHGGPCGGTQRGRLADTPEARAKKSAALRRKWEDPAYRERQREARAASYADPEVNRRKAAGIKRWREENPEAFAERNRKISETRRGQRSASGPRRLPSPESVPVSADELRRLHHDEGLSLRAMAERLGVSNGTISNWMAALDVPRRRQGRPTGRTWSAEERATQERARNRT